MFSTFEVSPVINPRLSFNKDHEEAILFLDKKGVYSKDLRRAEYISFMASCGHYPSKNLKLSSNEERRIKKFYRNEEDPSLMVSYLLCQN